MKKAPKSKAQSKAAEKRQRELAELELRLYDLAHGASGRHEPGGGSEEEDNGLLFEMGPGPWFTFIGATEAMNGWGAL